MTQKYLIGTNQLLRWTRIGNQIQFLWPDGNRFDISFNTSAQSEVFLNCLNRISEAPDTEARLIKELHSFAVSNASEIVSTLLSKGILKRACGGTAVEARSFHSFTEHEQFRDDLGTAEVRHLLQNAHRNQFPIDRALPEPVAPPELRDLFCAGRSNYPCALNPISDVEMSTLLALTYGRHEALAQGRSDGDIFGVTGSAGGFFPLRLVIHSRDTLMSAPPFSWMYIREEHALARINVDANATQEFASIFRFISDHGYYLLISIMIDLKWSQIKYGNHAYRLALLEAGAIMQNLRLASRRLGMENYPIGIPIGNDLCKILPACSEYMHALTIGVSKSAEGLT